MNSRPMSNIDKHVLHTQQLKSFITGFLRDPAHDNQSSRSMTAEVFRIALASLEAEPYGYVHKAAYEQAGSCGLSSDHEAYRDSSTHIAVYTAPPAPVSVPDERYQHLSELYHAQEKRLFKLAQRIRGPSFDKYAHSPSQAIDVLESAIFGEREDDCRAAMLQGAEPVSNHDESQVVVLHMGQAMSVFEALKKEALSEHVRHTELGEIGAVNVQVWTSVLGGALQYETSNGGCTLRVIQAEPQQEVNP